MKNLKIVIILATHLFVLHSPGKTKQPTFSQVIDGGLLFIEKSQKKDQPPYFDGEWSAEMKAYLLPALLGVAKLWAKPVQEPSAFVSSSIAKALHQIYQTEPHRTNLPIIANKALDSTTDYRAAALYGYYSQDEVNGVKIRGPRDEDYAPDYLSGLTHVPPDTDTTAVTYTAFLMWVPNYQMPKETLESFEKFRDLERTSHYYNFLTGVRNTGAFLTWQFDEKDPKRPKGLFAPPEKGERIPFGKNDVDCIVNGNTLHLLTLSKKTETPGYKEACQLLNDAVIESKQKTCGIYYPNSYALFFTNSNAYKDGAKCLEASRDASIKYILSNQANDGSWSNEPGIGRTDQVQSTALAMNALMNYSGDQVTDSGIRSSLDAAAKFLKSKAQCSKSGECSWEGEVFFSAVAQARNTVLWRSTPYTTTLATLALVRARAQGLTEL